MKTQKAVLTNLAALVLVAGTAAADAAQTTEALGNLAGSAALARGSARVMAMDATYVGVAEGAGALQWNPGGLGVLPGGEVGLHHAAGLGNSIDDVLLLAAPLGGLGGLAASVAYHDAGAFEGRDAVGNLGASYHAGSVGGSLGWGLALPMNLAAGIALKGTQTTLADMTYASFAVDVGAIWQVRPALRVGAAIADLGSSGSASSLGTTIRLGGSYVLDPAPRNHVLAAASLDLQPNGLNAVSVGAEDTLLSALALRVGYRLNLTDQQLTGLTGLTAGLGVSFSDFSVDYAYLPFGDLGNTQQVSLTYRQAAKPHEDTATGGAR